MMCRIHIGSDQLSPIQVAMSQIADQKKLEIRVGSPDERSIRPNLAIYATRLENTPRAILDASSIYIMVSCPAFVG